MIELSVQNLEKSFEVGQKLLDGLSFEIHTGECVGIMGRNGCGKTTLFRMLTGEIEPDEGTIVFAPDRRIGLISQIPVYPQAYTVEDVLRSAYRDLFSMKAKMERLERQMQHSAERALLAEYDRLSTAYEVGGGYEMDTSVDKICNGLGIPTAQRQQLFSSLSGGDAHFPGDSRLGCFFGHRGHRIGLLAAGCRAQQHEHGQERETIVFHIHSSYHNIKSKSSRDPSKSSVSPETTDISSKSISTGTDAGHSYKHFFFSIGFLL